MICRACRFETERLLVKEWHTLSPGEWQQQELSQVVATLLTEPVTRSLPPSWQGGYTRSRASQWIEAQDEEGTTLLIVDKSTRQAIGLIILYETEEEEGSGGMEVRLGYLLAEPAWGQGFASEVVRGFVGWCREQPLISSIVGGVAPDNAASKRVLEKNGFRLVPRADALGQDEDLFRLPLRS